MMANESTPFSVRLAYQARANSTNPTLQTQTGQKEHKRMDRSCGLDR
jgi:hypothetical protein